MKLSELKKMSGHRILQQVAPAKQLCADFDNWCAEVPGRVVNPWQTFQGFHSPLLPNNLLGSGVSAGGGGGGGQVAIVYPPVDKTVQDE